MKTIEERLNELFGNSEYVKEHSACGDFDELFIAVQRDIPEITKNELEEYLQKLAKLMTDDELTVDEMDNVSGGVVLAAAATWAALKTAAAVVGAVMTAGMFVGRYLKGRG